MEDRENRLARLGIGRHPRRHDDRVRTQPQRLPRVHGSADTERLGFVTGRQHHPAAHDDRFAAQPRLITLFDRGVERVEVGVQDRGFGAGLDTRGTGGGIGHEHMFASGYDEFGRSRCGGNPGAQIFGERAGGGEVCGVGVAFMDAADQAQR